ncbi:MAG: CHRD domain-containing protein [Acetobacteraceae bacterium]|nr:CHRD domain-containing protein [Acetobacteraceae bacterium]
MGKAWSLVPGILAMLFICGGAWADQINFKADLSGANEVPPVTTAGKGSATATLDTGPKTLTWTVDYSGLSGPVTAAHIHGPAAAGTNAGVLVPLGTNLANPIKGSATLTDAQVSDLEAGRTYVNLHTADNKGGEIRGQLQRSP